MKKIFFAVIALVFSSWTFAGAVTLNPTIKWLYDDIIYDYEDQRLFSLPRGLLFSAGGKNYKLDIDINNSNGTAWLKAQGSSIGYEYQIKYATNPIALFIYCDRFQCKEYRTYQGTPPDVAVWKGSVSFQAYPVNGSELWSKGFNFTSDVWDWGYDGYVKNTTFAFVRAKISPVPLPESAPLLIGALGLIGLFHRKKNVAPNGHIV